MGPSKFYRNRYLHHPGVYDWGTDIESFRNRIERPATINDTMGTDHAERRTVIEINGRPYLLKKGGETK